MTQVSPWRGLFNISINLIIPTIILIKASSATMLGPFYALIMALLFPLLYGLWELLLDRKKNILSFIGLANVMLTGGIGLFKMSPIWISIKEALIPFMIGIVILGSMYTRGSVVMMLINTLLNEARIQKAIKIYDKEKDYQGLIKRGTYGMAMPFFLSAGLNFFLAKYVVTSPAGTTDFTKELGQLTALSFPVIVLPCTIATLCTFYYIARSIQGLTQLTWQELLIELHKP